jgi:hypothetical protein
MTLDPGSFPKVLTLYLELSQYPILAARIRERMLQELFRRGVIESQSFEAEVNEKAVQSQEREGLLDPYREEQPDVWRTRVEIVRDHLIDFYFAYNLPHELFEELVRQTLAERVPSQDVVLTFHPELAPWDMLFAQGEAYEALPTQQRKPVEHHLKEIKVVLIKTMISDHLRYVGIAKDWFDIAALQSIRARRLGRGKIGGKAGGLMLAECILRKTADPELGETFVVPRSWFLGADVFYQFAQHNNLLGFANHKYKSEAEIRSEYETIRARFRGGRLPEDVADGLREILERVGPAPLIVRSSSLLEDSFGTSFAGKYESHFCPNQGDRRENLRELVRAISLTYASVYSPDALVYRRRMGLLDYDERMAVLIQEVQGREHHGAYLPDAAGVAFSRNAYRWSPRIDRRAGFVRLVWGLGTRAVDPSGGDYPRLVALSHPELRPESGADEILRYSQHLVDLIDLAGKRFTTRRMEEVLTPEHPALRWIAQRHQDGHLQDFVSRPIGMDHADMVITFEGLLGKTEFPQRMRRLLALLEAAYGQPVDTEFALVLEPAGDASGRPRVFLLQCRPQSRLEAEAVRLPRDVPRDKVLFVSRRMVPDGKLSGIRYVVYIPDQAYAGLAHKSQAAQLIGRINDRLAGESFVLIGPGRWGSSNPDLGIPVSYAQIYNAKALVETTGGGQAPEPSYGTHFFQDLIEANIYPLAVARDDPGAEFRYDFFEGCPSILGELLPEFADWSEVVRVIDVPRATGAYLELVMDGDEGAAMAYLGPETSTA